MTNENTTSSVLHSTDTTSTTVEQPKKLTKAERRASKAAAKAAAKGQTPPAATGTDAEVAKAKEMMAKAKEMMAKATANLSPEAKERLAKAAKAEKAARANRETRVSAAVKALRKLNGTPKTIKDLRADADAIYAASGGKSSETEGFAAMRAAVEIGVIYGFLSYGKDGVRKVADMPGESK